MPIILNAQRVLAHRIVWGKNAFFMSVATASRDGSGRWHISIEPFSGETAATVFHSGAVFIENPDGTPFTDNSDLKPFFRGEK